MSEVGSRTRDQGLPSVTASGFPEKRNEQSRVSVRIRKFTPRGVGVWTGGSRRVCTDDSPRTEVGPGLGTGSLRGRPPVLSSGRVVGRRRKRVRSRPGNPDPTFLYWGPSDGVTPSGSSLHRTYATPFLEETGGHHGLPYPRRPEGRSPVSGRMLDEAHPRSRETRR